MISDAFSLCGVELRGGASAFACLLTRYLQVEYCVRVLCLLVLGGLTRTSVYQAAMHGVHTYHAAHKVLLCPRGTFNVTQTWELQQGRGFTQGR